MAWGSAHVCICIQCLCRSHTLCWTGLWCQGVEAHTYVWRPCLSCCCRHFNMVVIDEATQATEPATLVPLTQVCCMCAQLRTVSMCYACTSLTDDY